MDVIEIAKEAALEALREYKKEERNSIKSNKLHNTGLLLDHSSNLLTIMKKFNTGRLTSLKI
jgi:hypothetical protein